SIPETLGYWKAEGLDVEITTLEGSTAGVQQLAAGNIQFATVGPETALISREKGVKIKAFYAISRVTIFRVVVPQGSPIQGVTDLRGKTIGVSALTSGAVPVARALVASGGMDPDKDVKWLAVGVGAPAAVAITQKSVDAMALWGDFQAGFENQRVDNREDKRWGASSPAQWARLKTLYREQNLIQGTGDVNEVFTNQLIDEINRFDQQAVIRQAREYR